MENLSAEKFTMKKAGDDIVLYRFLMGHGTVELLINL